MNKLKAGSRKLSAWGARGLMGLGLAAVCLWGLARPAAAASPVSWAAAKPVVHAIFFYSMNCSHCETLITNYLPPLGDQFGRQLQMLMVDVNETNGKALYQAAIKYFKIPYDRWGVPMVIIGDQVLVGADEIPAQFQGLVQTYLAQGGVAWPELTGLPEMVASVPAWSVDAVAASTSLPDKLASDPVGNGLSMVVLVGMVLAAGYTTVTFFRTAPAARRVGKRSIATPPPALPAWRTWVVLALAVAGLAIAGYLTYVEVGQAAAVCGPVGDCQAVQQSAYSRLFNVIPVGALGVAGYGLMVGAWLVGRLATGRLAERGALALLGLAALSTLFSIYLTFLEPFVIGAACTWCLASAIITTALLWLTAAPAKRILFN